MLLGLLGSVQAMLRIGMTRGLLQEVQPQTTPALRPDTWNHAGPWETPAPASCSNGHGFSGPLVEFCLCLRTVTLLLLWAPVPAFDCLLGEKKWEKKSLIFLYFKRSVQSLCRRKTLSELPQLSVHTQLSGGDVEGHGSQ